MVFDWFKRSLAPQARPDPEPAPALEPVEEAPAAAVPQPASEPAESTAAAPPVEDVPAPAAVDQDALAWARQAYLRLKAEQEAQRAQAAPPATAPPAPVPAPAPAAEPPPAPVAAAAEPPAPEAPPAPLWTATVAAETPAPAAPPEAPTSSSPGPSLLELAAAQRRQRLEEITAPAAAPAPGPVATAAAPSQAPVREAEAEPELGAFDDTFTWSAEVLAAQGRRVEEVSLEEIDWLGRLRQGLEKTRRGFVTQLLERLGDDPLTPEVLDDLESTLLSADVGVQATDQVLEALRQRLNEEVVDPAEGIRFLKEQLRGLLEEPITASGRSLLAPERDRLNVWLMVGVNGVGKTTTLGKLANLAVRSGYSALIAAADTFRAAAVQQVKVWGERSGVPVIANPSANADPAAVVFDAIGAARAQGTELVLVDTAGRLQTKHNLMEELAKVRRIVDRLAPEAAVESLLILDASQGQNGLRQAMAFAGAAGLTGVVITKLDGSARGGVAIAVAHEAGLPIRFIGAGEGIRDLRPFNSYEFVEALLAS
ncbi:signal recognition particle-docking protein FtsY [Cyanobium sp. FGCU-52]|nr:signal recognition particle-docking protein FtsY [Cyanobium sp. FGCU52]